MGEVLYSVNERRKSTRTIAEVVSRVARIDRAAGRRLAAVDWMSAEVIHQSSAGRFACYELRRHFLELQSTISHLFQHEVDALAPSMAALESRPDFIRYYGPITPKVDEAESICGTIEARLGEMRDLAETCDLPRGRGSLAHALGEEIAALCQEVKALVELRREELFPLVRAAHARVSASAMTAHP